MHAHKERHKAFLLRLWQADQNGDPVWRVLLENPRTGGGLDMLIDFLFEQIQKMGYEE